MHNPEWRNELSRRLRASGCPTGEVSRLLQELGDHQSDLIAEGRDGGLSPSSALEYASARLGSAEELAKRCIQTRQRTDWWGRHPGLLFGVAPLIVFLLSAAGATLLLALIGSFYGWWERPSKLSEDTWMVLTMMIPLFYFSLVTGIPVLICRVAGYYCRGWRWALLACASLSIHAYFHHFNVSIPLLDQRGSIVWGYGVSSNLTRNLWTAAPPLLVFLFYFLRTSLGSLPATAHLFQTTRAGIWAGLVLGLSAGALHAGDKVHSRGWIGGDYELAKKTRILERRDIVGAFPSELREEQRAGIFVQSVPTNSPAAQAGLRAGDLLLRVNGEKAEKLRAFHKLVERAEPGQPLSLAIWRGGARQTLSVVVGREHYRNIGTLGLGLHFSNRLDLWPNPSFSLFVLGYDRRDERLELHSSRSRFIRRVRELDGAPPDVPLSSREGWNATLVIFHGGAHKRILSQEPAEL